MTSPAAGPPAAEPGEIRRILSRGRADRLGWPLLVTALTFAYALVPALIGARDFYRRGDSASQFLPTWYHLGELLRSGVWPPVLDPGSWQGGNYAAEALFGIYNPVNALNWLLVSSLPDLDLAATLVKAELLTILALGVYLLCREYAAARWASSLVAVALPFAGFTLYWEAASWASGLSAFMYLPHVWWSLRKVGRGVLSPVWAFLIGALAVTQGNPYGVLGIVVVGIGLLVEFSAQRQWGSVGRLLITGACVALVIPLVFAPLLATASLAHRSQLTGIANTGNMRPNLGDLLNLSAPSYQPDIVTPANPMQVPATYFFWLLLPMLPWLRWSVLRAQLSRLTGVVTVLGLYVLFTLAPSSLWMFRWPLRLVEYLHLCLAVLLAVALSAGLADDKRRARLFASVSLVVFGGYLSWAQTPDDLWAHVAGAALVAALVAGFVEASRSRRRWLPPVVVGQLGTLAVLSLQATVFPENVSAANWDLPASVQSLRDRLGSHHRGTTIQFANIARLRVQSDREGSDVWGRLTGGSVYHLVGVPAVNVYTGVGLEAFTDRLCMRFDGGTFPCGYAHVLQPAGPRLPSLAELLKVHTMVLQRRVFQKFPAPTGWKVSLPDSHVVVLHPARRWAWPQSRLSWVSSGLTVESARTVSPTEEVVQVTAGPRAPQELIFARLGWPGYSATFDGQPVEVSRTQIGLLRVKLPAGNGSGEVRVQFTPPGQHVGLGLAALGLVGALAAGAFPAAGRRMRSRR